MTSRHRSVTLLLAALTLAPCSARGQEDRDLRVGVSLGGTSLVAHVLEVVGEHRGVELTVGTWSFRDVSVSVVAKEYLGAAAARPVLGLGLWAVAAWSENEPRAGLSLVARAPVGVEWRPGGGHALSALVNVNRALWVRRSDPGDTTPINRRLVPLPGVSYTFRY